MPMMTTRLVISLRKAAGPLDTASDVRGAAEVSNIRFARRTFGGTERRGGGVAPDSVPLGEELIHLEDGQS